MKNKIFLVSIIIMPLIGKSQYFRDSFLGSYPSLYFSWDNNIYSNGSDHIYVNPSPTDTNNIIILDSLGWLGYEYILYPDSSFAHYWVPNLKYGHFYSTGDSIFVHDTHNAPWYRELHGGRLGTGINDISKSTFSIYPNPVSNILYIKLNNSFSNKLQFQLFNSIGQLVLQNSIQLLSKTQIDLPPLPDGIYFIKIEYDNSSFSQKLLIQN